ncbi:MAG: hypothetical protein U9Q88_19680 [Bacillota bacterium]|nr:hypothetical protein [Bacillota bacterium]
MLDKIFIILSLNGKSLLIGVEGEQMPAGGRGQVKPHRRKPRRLTDRPQVSEALGTEINSDTYFFINKTTARWTVVVTFGK